MRAISLALAALLMAALLAGACKRTRAPREDAPRDAGPDMADAAGRDPAGNPAGNPAGDPGRERIVLASVAVHTVDPEVPREIFPRQLAQRLGMLLTDSGLFAATPAQVPEGLRPRPATLEVRIRYDVLEQGSAGGPAVVVAVESRILWDPPSPDAAPAERVLVERPVHPGDDPGGLIAAHAADTMALVARGLEAKERLRTAGEAALAEVLADQSAPADMVAWALTLVAERRSAALFDAVAGHLAAADDAVRRSAVAALVALGDRRAVELLARQVRFDDHAFLPAVIDAALALGGEDARAYLDFLASGHPEEDIRTRAAQALERLGGQP